MSDKIFTAYITKYALSSGIKITTVEMSNISANMVQDLSDRWGLYHGKDWHRTREEAIKRAEEMRMAKRASLTKQIAKLVKLDFEATS